MSRAADRRSYDASGRRERAAENRSRLLEAAGELFLEKGYAATSVKEIAERAGVSPESVYGWFGSKAQLLMRWVDVTVVGDEEPVALMDRAWVAEASSEPSPELRLEVAARHWNATTERAAPAMRVWREAVSSDPRLAEEFERGQRRRHDDTAVLVDLILGDGTPGSEEAIDFLWALLGDQLYTALVIDTGWTLQQYHDWMTAMTRAALMKGAREP